MQAVIVAVHLLVAAVCAWECVTALFDLRGRIPRLLMFGALGLIHGLVPAITPLGLLNTEYSLNSRIQAAMLALIGVVLFSMGWRLWEFAHPLRAGLSPTLDQRINSREGQTFLRRLFILCAVVGIVAWVASVLAMGVGLGEIFYRARFESRRYEEFYLAAMAQYLVVLSIVPGFVGFFLPRSYRMIGVVYAVGMAVLLFLASQGTRANPLGLLGGVFMGYALRHRISMVRAVGIGAAGAMILLLSVSLYDVRKTMARQTAGEMVATVLSPSTYQGALVKDPLNYHEFLVAAVEYFPSRHPFLNGATYRRLFVFFLPRRYFESIKPEDPNMTFAAVIDPGSAKELTTIPPSMMGDGYINFWGWPGVLIMFVNGVLFGFLHWKMRTSLLWLIAGGSMYVRLALLAVRGQPYEVFLLGVWVLLSLWAMARLLGFPLRHGHWATGQGTFPSMDRRRRPIPAYPERSPGRA